MGFAISNKLSCINPIPVNDRLMSVRMQLKDSTYLTIISVYAPTMQRTEEEKEASMKSSVNVLAELKVHLSLSSEISTLVWGKTGGLGHQL